MLGTLTPHDAHGADQILRLEEFDIFMEVRRRTQGHTANGKTPDVSGPIHLRASGTWVATTQDLHRQLMAQIQSDGHPMIPGLLDGGSTPKPDSLETLQCCTNDQHCDICLKKPVTQPAVTDTENSS